MAFEVAVKSGAFRKFYSLKEGGTNLPLICVYLHVTENVGLVSELFMANVTFELWINIMDVQMGLQALKYLTTNLAHFSDFFFLLFRLGTFL